MAKSHIDIITARRYEHETGDSVSFVLAKFYNERKHRDCWTENVHVVQTDGKTFVFSSVRKFVTWANLHMMRLEC